MGQYAQLLGYKVEFYITFPSVKICQPMLKWKPYLQSPCPSHSLFFHPKQSMHYLHGLTQQYLGFSK